MAVSWRAVGFGVAVVLVLAFLAVLLPVAGHLAVGAAGGFVGGVLGGGGRRGGATHGAAVGVVGGALMLVAGVAVAFTFGVPRILLTFVDLSRAAFAGVLAGSAVLLALAAAGGGALGGVVRGDRPLPSEPRTRQQ
jgi:hypothetical protein